MESIQPFGNRVAVEIINPEQTLGGLVIPTSKEKSNRGIVVAVGDGDEVKNVKVGDTVIFQLGTGLDYVTKDRDYKVLNVRDIVGKIIEGSK